MSIAAGERAARQPFAAGGAAAVWRRVAGRGRRLAWQRPEWWALGLTVVAWGLLLAPSWTGPGREAHAAHGVHSAPAAQAAHSGHGDAVAGGASIVTGTAHWLLMVIAMMLPVMVPSLRLVAFRSLWRRRHRAVAGFLVGYLAIWGVAGLAVCLVLAWLPVPTREWQATAAAGAFLLAAAWQWTRLKQRSLVTCHRTTPIAPSGLRADRDCIVFGWRLGCWCCVSCFFLMVACTLTGHSALALLACGGIGFAERYSWRPNPKRLSFGMVALALVAGLALR